MLFIDGYRGQNSIDDLAVVSFVRSLKVKQVSHVNQWTGPGDSLSDRFNRLIQWWNENNINISKLNIFAFSMGCQLALRFGEYICNKDSEFRFNEVVFVAPDPKARPVGRDHEETASGITSAYDEAKSLWHYESQMLEGFLNALLKMAGMADHLRIVISQTDGVAVYKNNVDHIVRHLNGKENVGIVFAQDGEIVKSHGVIIDLTAPAGNYDVHDRLWDSVRIIDSFSAQ